MNRKSEAGAALAARRRREKKSCEKCGKKFRALAIQRFCSVWCQQAAGWERRAAAKLDRGKK